MRIILDECLPKRLTKELPGHDARTVQQMGWGGISNGNLLALLGGQFDAFITVDSNLAYQQCGRAVPALRDRRISGGTPLPLCFIILKIGVDTAGTML
jgi:hypothetical protein